MAAKMIGRTSMLASGLVLAVGLHAPVFAQSSQDFTMRVLYAVTYTPFAPNGQNDTSPPFTLCANNQIGLRFSYTWRHPFEEYIYTETVGTLYPYMYVQGIYPSPLFVPAAPVGSPVVKLVDVGLISGQVNTGGTRLVQFRGRTSGLFGNSVRYANTTALIETQMPPVPTRYREIEDRTLDMPTQPWFGWERPSLASDTFRLDLGLCSIQDPSLLECGASTLPSVVSSPECGTAPLCWTGAQNEHQLAQTLATDSSYRYRVYGMNQCGLNQPPSLPTFRTAQACFVSGASIPDGGVLNVDAATLGLNPGSLVPNLRVTVHADHADVSDLRISLTKTSPVVAGPLLLLDRPSASGCVGGTRIQAAFADNGTPISSGCNPLEPAINGRVSPLQALASFAPLQGEGTWRLSIEDTNADGKAGTLREWCLSADVALRATAFTSPLIFADGFE